MPDTLTMAGCLRRARAPASRRDVSAAASISAGLAPPSAMARLSRIQMLTTGLAVPAWAGCLGGARLFQAHCWSSCPVTISWLLGLEYANRAIRCSILKEAPSTRECWVDDAIEQCRGSKLPCHVR